MSIMSKRVRPEEYQYHHFVSIILVYVCRIQITPDKLNVHCSSANRGRSERHFCFMFIIFVYIQTHGFFLMDKPSLPFQCCMFRIFIFFFLFQPLSSSILWPLCLCTCGKYLQLNSFGGPSTAKAHENVLECRSACGA